MPWDDDNINEFAAEGKRKRKRSRNSEVRDSDLWYERYPRRFREATSRMSFELRGAYSLIIDLYFEHGKPLPDDDKWIAFSLHIDVRKWRNIRAQLYAAKKLFTGKDGLIHNELADELLAIRKARVAKDRGQIHGSTPPSTGGSLGGDFSKKTNEIKDGATHINSNSRQSTKIGSPSITKVESLSKSEEHENASQVIDLDEVRLVLGPMARAIIESFNVEPADEYLRRARAEVAKGTRIRNVDLYCTVSAAKAVGISKAACKKLLNGDANVAAAVVKSARNLTLAEQARVARMSAPSSARANLAKALKADRR